MKCKKISVTCFFFLGRYIYFESSSPVASGQQGIVESKTLSPTQAICMSFYYSMYGNTMGSLRVYIKDMNNQHLQSNGRKVWEMTGNQGESWHHANITIISSTRFKVMIVIKLWNGSLGIVWSMRKARVQVS